MAKNQKKPAKRVFFVSRNMDDVADIVVRYPVQDATEALWGEFYGSKGADRSVCEGKSHCWVLGWEIGYEAYTEAVDRFESAREAGRKSAESREARNGTAQPTGGRGHRTTNRTDNRRGFDESTEGGSVISDDSDPKDEDEHRHADGIRQKGSKGTTEPNGQPKGVRLNTERSTELANTQYPVPSNQDGPLKMTSRDSACAHEQQNEQNDNNEHPDPEMDEGIQSLLTIYRGGYPSSRKISDLPPLKSSPNHFPGKKEAA